MACLPHPGQPETQQLSRWLKDFFPPTQPCQGSAEGPVLGLPCEPGLEPLGACPDVPPSRCGGQGVQLGPQGSLEEGSVCPACGADSRQLIGGGARLWGEGSVWPLDVGGRPTFQTPHWWHLHRVLRTHVGGKGYIRARGCQCILLKALDSSGEALSDSGVHLLPPPLPLPALRLVKEALSGKERYTSLGG